MKLDELVRDTIASLNNGNFWAASSIAKEIARLGGSMDGNYKEKVLERIQKLEQDALKYDARGDTAQASSIVAEVERWRRSLGASKLRRLRDVFGGRGDELFGAVGALTH